MTIRDFVGKYRGWCPHFESKINSLAPYTNLTINGRMTYISLLLLTGLSTIVVELYYLTMWNGNQIVWYMIIGYVFELFSAILLVILTIDFLTVGTILRRHKIEFLGFVGFTAMSRLFGLIYGLQRDISLGVPLTPGIYGSYINRLVAVVLGAYVVYRLISDRKILVKNTFLLLTVYFTASLLSGLADPLLGFWFKPTALVPLVLNLLGIIVTGIVEFVGVYFFSRTYLELRHRPSFELSFPIYVRSTLFLYGSFNLFMTVYYLLNPNPSMTFDAVGGIVNYVVLIGLSVMLFLTYILAAFHPLVFNVGEGVTNVEVGVEV